jgi:tetratricopeptide (TPR) repeat protein
MPLIRIQERPSGQGGSNAVVSFDHGPEYLININAPFSEKQEQELEWYFEEYLEFPFTKKVRAQDASFSIKTYGEELFKQVFGDPDIYAEYRDILKTSLNSLHIEIAGSPKFHALHWEAMKDPKLLEPLTLQATMVRKNLKPQALPASVRTSPTINLLVVTARPSGTRDVGYRTITRPLVEALRNANLRVQVELLRPGTYRSLENHLRDVTAKHGEGYYHVIHFDMHGAVLTYKQFEHIQKEPPNTPLQYSRYARNEIQPYEGVKAFLSFETEADDEKKSDLVEASELAGLLVKHHMPITILNACQSGKQIGERETSLGSHLIQAGLQLVLAMGYSITVSAAKLLMSSLYQRLFAGDDLAIAICHARTELYNKKQRRAYFDQQIDLEDWLLPVVYQNQPVTLQPREFTREERAAWFERKAEEKRYTPPDPQYGFVGRDIDVLQIEKRLLTKRNILLVRGMGGAGKTTLLRHLAAWWHTTGFVQRVFYFGYDEKDWSLQQIMTDIAQQLYGQRYYTDFQSYSPAAQQAMLSQDMRSKNHLLILDNLESITGEHLVIQHTLPPNEQSTLRSFLTDLAKGYTLVLLGSRGGEDWLARGTFDENIYELPGLDPEAASTMADRVLERNNASKYRQDEEIRKLIKVLDGFPLALEVVLANLAHQTPTEVLEALQAGDVSIDPKSDSQDKTESILRCIDYSHSYLSPEAQQLLLCLAPFTSVIDTGMLDDYTSHLRQQPVLASLPFESWPDVLREVENGGLLSPDPAIPRFLRLQPIFPYFLRNRLYVPEQGEVRSAVETAFREHYDQLGDMLNKLLNSKDPQLRQVGQIFASLEYENLMTALKLALEAQASIYNLCGSLSHYLDAAQDQRRGLELGQMVLAHLETYSSDLLAGSLGTEFARIIGDIANRQLRLKDYQAAEASYQKGLKLIAQLKHIDKKEQDGLKAGTYHNLGVVAQNQRQWKEAEQYYQQALQISSVYKERHAQASTFHQLGILAEEQQEFQQAKQYYQQALQIKIEHNDRYSQADTYHNLGVVAEKQREFQQAKQYHQQALQIYIEYNDRYSQASPYHGLALIALDQRQWKEAEQYYQQALQIYIEYNDRYSQAWIYHQLGIVAHEQREFQQAEQYYQQALQISSEYNDHYGQAKIYHQLGVVEQEQQQWIQAEQYYQQALQIDIKYNDRYAQAATYLGLGIVAQQQRRWQQAEQYYQQALQIFLEYNDRYAQAKTYGQLGLLEQERLQWSQASDYLLRALEIFIAYKDNYFIGITVRSLALLWKASGNESLPAAVATSLGASVEETERLLLDILGKE